MAPPSDRRLLALCLVAATVGFVVQVRFQRSSSPGSVFLVAVVVLAALVFVDGFLQSA